MKNSDSIVTRASVSKAKELFESEDGLQTIFQEMKQEQAVLHSLVQSLATSGTGSLALHASLKRKENSRVYLALMHAALFSYCAVTSSYKEFMRDHPAGPCDSEIVSHAVADKILGLRARLDEGALEEIDELEPVLSGFLDVAGLSFAKQVQHRSGRNDPKRDVALVIECKLIGAFVWQALRLGYQQVVEGNDSLNTDRPEQDLDAA